MSYQGTTDASGLVTTTVFTANGVVGSYAVVADAPGVLNQALFNLTNQSLGLADNSDISLKLTPALSGPNPLNSTVWLTATLIKHGLKPVANASVVLTITSDVNGASPIISNAITNNQGQVSFKYSRSFTTTDHVTATSNVGGMAIPSSATNANKSTVNWVSSPNQISTGPVNAKFYSLWESRDPDNVCQFVKGKNDAPVFEQQFQSINFSGYAFNAFNQAPWYNHSFDPNGNPLPPVAAISSGIGNDGFRFQPGVEPLSNFQGVFTSNFVVGTSGTVSLDILADDGFLLGIGANANGDQPTFISQTTVPITNNHTVSVLKDYPIMGVHDAGAGEPLTISVNFPAPGIYPYEVDYFQCFARFHYSAGFQLQPHGSPVGIPSPGAITLTPNTVPDPLNVGQPISFTVNVTDAVGQPARQTPVTLRVAGTNTQSLDSVTDDTGQATFAYIGETAGTDQVQAVSWPRGQIVYTGQTDLVFTGTNLPSNKYPPGCTAPVVSDSWLSSPLNGDSVSGQVALKAVRRSSVSWSPLFVDYWPANDVNARSILVSTTSTFYPGYTLATVDTTKLANGPYIVRVCSNSLDNQPSTSLTLINVVGENKLGRVTFSLTDLTVPVAGLPIEIGRTYDSLGTKPQRGFWLWLETYSW